MRMLRLTVIPTLLLLVATCVSLLTQAADEWELWHNEVNQRFLSGGVVRVDTAESDIHELCIKLDPNYGSSYEQCMKSQLTQFSNQRGKENGIFIKLQADSTCREVVVVGEFGNAVVKYDQLDTVDDVVEEIALYLNISHDPQVYQSLLQQVMDLMGGYEQASIEQRQCPDARARRRAHESILYTSRSLEVSEFSSVRCEYPFHNKEWLIPEFDNLLPIGTCVFDNLYLHNSKWYFVSDDPGAASIPLTRLNTVCLEFRGLSSELHPKIVTKAELEILMKYSQNPKEKNLLKLYEGVLILMNRLTIGNHGHALLDEVLPIMWALDMHNFSVTEDDMMIAFSDIYGRDQVDDRFRIISPHRTPLYRSENPTGWLCAAGSWCRYSHVLGGYGGMGFVFHPTQSFDRYNLYEVFRKQAAISLKYPLFDINKDYLPGMGAPVHTILIVQRYGARGFSASVLSQMKKLVSDTLPNSKILVEYFDDVTLEYQAHLMQSISIMIAVDGTAIDNALFMPPCTGIIDIGRDILNSEQYIMNDGFEMHAANINLWSQWLSIELYESPPGSWIDEYGAGPLNSLLWNDKERAKFTNAIRNVMRKRDVCAQREGYVKEMGHNSMQCLFEAPSTSEQSSGRREVMTIREVYTPVDHSASSDVVAKVLLSGDNAWYQISDFWRFSVTSSVPFLQDLYSMLEPHLHDLFHGKNVFVINSGDGFIPVLSFYNGCRSLELLEAVPFSASQLTDLFKKVFTDIKVFFQHLFMLYASSDPAGFYQHKEIDTLLVFGGALDGSSLYHASDSSGNILESTEVFIQLLASKTKEKLILEFIPKSNCDLFQSSMECLTNACDSLKANEDTSREEIKELEHLLRLNFLSFSLLGHIKSTNSFLYMATAPLRNVEREISKQSIQGIIVSPANGTILARGIDGVAVLRVSVIVTGPPELLLQMKNIDKRISAELNDTAELREYLSPRLFLDKKGGGSSSGCISNDKAGCYGKYTTRIEGNLHFLTYELVVHDLGTYDITFQMLRYANRIYMAYSAADLRSQHSVQIQVL